MIMTMLRNILAVISGYAVFAGSALLLFQWSGIDPHADPSLKVIIVTIGYGLIFSFLGGLLTQVISGSRTLTINYVLGVMMAGFATFSLFKSAGSHFSQLAAIFLFAPASILGGVAYRAKRKR